MRKDLGVTAQTENPISINESTLTALSPLDGRYEKGASSLKE